MRDDIVAEALVETAPAKSSVDGTAEGIAEGAAENVLADTPAAENDGGEQGNAKPTAAQGKKGRGRPAGRPNKPKAAKAAPAAKNEPAAEAPAQPAPRRVRRRATPATNGSAPHAAGVDETLTRTTAMNGSEPAATATVQVAELPPELSPELVSGMSERYVSFLHSFQRDRTLPPHPIIEPGYDITTLSIEELSSSDEVYNRELSWLDFNWRVLHEAVDPRTPLLERLKFIAITSSNLDEYFSKRVGGLKRQKAAGVANLTLDGWAPDVQLSLIKSHTAYRVTEQCAKAPLMNTLPIPAIIAPDLSPVTIGSSGKEKISSSTES
jgi:hypothetical protein